MPRAGVVDVMPRGVIRMGCHALVEIFVRQVGYNIKHFVYVEAHRSATGHCGHGEFDSPLFDQPFDRRQPVMGYALFHGTYVNLLG